MNNPSIAHPHLKDPTKGVRFMFVERMRLRVFRSVLTGLSKEARSSYEKEYYALHRQFSPEDSKGYQGAMYTRVGRTELGQRLFDHFMAQAEEQAHASNANS